MGDDGVKDKNAQGRNAVFDLLGEHLMSGKEYEFYVQEKTMSVKGQVENGELVAFQLYPGDGSVLFMSFAANKITSQRRAGMFAAKMVIDWWAEQPHLEAGEISKDLYDFLATEEGQALWEGN